MAKSKELKIVITGPGRSGTTFLVKLFTFAGFATGFSEEFIESSASADAGWADTPGGDARAWAGDGLGDATQNPGLEQPVDAISSSRLEVLKSPEWSHAHHLQHLESMRNRYDLDVYLVVPVRNTSDIARSRIRRSATPDPWNKGVAGRYGGPISGIAPNYFYDDASGAIDRAIGDATDCFKAEKRIAEEYLGSIRNTEQHDEWSIPITYLDFEKMTTDKTYLYNELKYLLAKRSIREEEFYTAYDKATSLWRKGEF
jgi:hypothetical protein